jgi:putative membrane protein
MHALTIALLAAALIFYAWGVRNLWRREHATYFALGWCVVAIALLSPLHHYAEARVWAHMTQHQLLTIIAAPLVVLGRPLQAWSQVIPIRVPRIFADPFFAWGLHAVALWLWHVPVFFRVAVENEWLHLAQHTSFFLSAAIFWWAVLTGRSLAAMALLFAAMLHTGVLGLLMAFSATAWYAGYTLEDQQFAALLMWIPAGTVYPVAALFLIQRSLRKFAA